MCACMCACEAAWVWLEACRVGPLSVLPWPYQIWAGRSLAQWNKEALRTRLGCGMWAQTPGGLLHPGGRGHGLEELLPPTPAKKFSCCRDTLSGGQQSLCSPPRASIPSLGVFSASALLTRPSPLPFHGVQRFSSPTSISPPGAFEPQSHWLLILEHALRFSSTHLLPMIHPPPLAQVIYAKPQTTSRKSPDIADPILTPVYFSPAPLV